MELKHWQHIEALFHEALLIEASARPAYLQAACSGNESLRREVESLISSFESEQGFLAQPALSLGWRLLSGRPQESLAGRVIGQYKILRLLGEGGMGQVYLAEDGKLERLVALKFLAANSGDEEWGRAHLTKEARAVARLEHPNICAVHGIEELEGYRFIVMQYVEGETLASLLVRDEPLAPQRTLNLAEQLVSALSSAHACGIIHRDIKPQNIVVTADGKVKILDFGLAKFVRPLQSAESNGGGDPDRSSHFGFVIGTIAYMSPEQTDGQTLDCQSDIFSFGIVLFEMLSGHNPFRRETEKETLAAIRENDPPPLCLLPHAPVEAASVLERIARKCLEKERGRRYQTTDELLQDLHGLRARLEGQVSRRRNLSPERRRRLRLYALSGFALILLLGVAAGFFYLRLSRVHTLAIFNVAAEQRAGSGEFDLGEGLSRGLSYRLSRLSRVQVKTPREVSVGEKQNVEFARLGRELGVEVVLVNKSTKRDDALFLHASLLRASDGARLWEQEFPMSAADLTTLSVGVMQQVAARLHLWLSDGDQALLTKRQTENPAALELYMRGQYYLSKRGEENLKTAIRFFEQAVDRDPIFAQAHAGLAEAYALRTTVAYGQESRQEMVNMARAAAKQALKIDGTLSEAHTALGIMQMRDEWNWKESERSFRQAIELNPDFAPAHFWYSLLLMTLGRNDAAIAESETARTLEPFSPSTLMNVGRAFFYARRYDKAAAAFAAMLEKDQRDQKALYMSGLVYLAQGMYAEGSKTLERLYSVNPLFAAAPLGYAYGKMNRRAEAFTVLDKLEELSQKEKDKPVPAQEKAIIYIGLNDKDKAFKYLEQAYAERFSSLISLTTDPLFADLRPDSRFADLARRLNLQP